MVPPIPGAHDALAPNPELRNDPDMLWGFPVDDLTDDWFTRPQ
jgi:hypothetical protein